MNVKVCKVYGGTPNIRLMHDVAGELDKGNVVLVPTDTGYAFVGCPFLKSTYQKFLNLRVGHPKNKPFSLLCAQLSEVYQYAEIDTPLYRFLQKLWPGPFTAILPSNRTTPVCALGIKSKTVGIRVPDHTMLQALLKVRQKPMLVTSVTDAEEINQSHYFEGELEDSWWAKAENIVLHFPKGITLALAEEDPCALRVSTVVNCTTGTPVLIRDGGWNSDLIRNLTN